MNEIIAEYKLGILQKYITYEMHHDAIIRTMYHLLTPIMNNHLLT